MEDKLFFKFIPERMDSFSSDLETKKNAIGFYMEVHGCLIVDL